jgi:hypothetical protein
VIQQNSTAAFSFDEAGAKEKAIKKKTLCTGLRAPTPRRLLKKVGENFSKKFCELSVCASSFFERL